MPKPTLSAIYLASLHLREGILAERGTTPEHLWTPLLQKLHTPQKPLPAYHQAEAPSLEQFHFEIALADAGANARRRGVSAAIYLRFYAPKRASWKH